jgi:WD40 repeat protein
MNLNLRLRSPSQYTLVLKDHCQGSNFWYNTIANLIFIFVMLSVFQEHVNASQDIKLLLTGNSAVVVTTTFSNNGKWIVNGSGMNIKLSKVSSGRLLGEFKGHKSFITSVAFSPDDQYIISASVDKTIKIWQRSSGSLLKTLKGHKKEVSFAVFSPDGSFILSGAKDGNLILWSAESGKKLIDFSDHKRSFMNGIFSQNGLFIYSVDNRGTIKKWDVSTGKLVKTVFSGQGQFKIKLRSEIKFSLDRRRVLLLRPNKHNGEFFCLNLKTGTVLQRLNPDDEGIHSVAISADGQFAATSPGLKKVRLWDLDSGKNIKTFIDNEKGRESTRVRRFANTADAAFSPDNKMIFLGNMEGINVWDIDSGKISERFKSNSFMSGMVTLSKDGNIGLSNGLSYRNEFSIWNLNNGRRINSFKTGKNNTELYSSLSNDGRLALFSQRGINSEIWETTQTKKIGVINGTEKYDRGVISPSGKFVFLASYKSGFLWDIQSKKAVKYPWSFKGKKIVKFFFDDSSVLLINNGQLKVLNLKTGKIVNSILLKTTNPVSSGLSRDGRFALISYMHDPTELWNITTKTIIQKFPKTNFSTHVSISEDNNHIRTANMEGKIDYWDIKSGNLLATKVVADNGWAVVAPDGRFDKSQGFNGLHYSNGMKSIDLSQFFDEFYTPSLLAEVLKSRKVSQENLLVKMQRKYPAPEVKIINPKPTDVRGLSVGATQIVKSKTGKAQVIIKATSTGGGIGSVTLFHNGKALGSSLKRGLFISAKEDCVNLGGNQGNQNLSKGKSEIYCFNVQLVPGKNSLRAVGKSLKRIESSPLELILDYRKPKEAEKPDLYLFTVGINNYRNQTLNLNYGRPDAEAVRHVIREKSKPLFNKVHSFHLIDDQASQAGIQSVFDKLINKIRTQDVLFFYYAGHGITLGDNSKGEKTDFYLVPYNATNLYNQNELRKVAISGSQLVQKSKKIKALKQVFILDACGSGGLKDAFAMRGSAEQKALAQLQRSSGVHMIAATESSQEAAEFKDLKHGVFTYAMLEEFNRINGDNTLTILQLTSKLQQRIPELSAQYRGIEQFPLAINSGQDFPLVLKTVKATPVVYTKPKVVPQQKQNPQKKKCTKEAIKKLVAMGFSAMEALEMCAK